MTRSAPRGARAGAALAAACLLLVAACGDDGDGGAADGGTTTTTSTTAAPSTTTRPAGPSTTTTAPFAGGVAPVELPASPAATVHLVDVRVAGHDGFDRVVFEFDEDLPSIRVRYADGPVEASGSGDVVEVEGDEALLVVLEPASGVDLSGTGAVPTYTGPARVRADTAEVTEVVRSGDFEGVLEWAVGVGGRVPFRVTTEAAPPRVVIDVQAP